MKIVTGESGRESLRYRLLLWGYRLGIPAALAAALSGSAIFRSLGLRVPDLSAAVLYLALSHMAVLVVLGFTLREPRERRSAGARIGTAGYLHTLIGFTSALFQIRPEGFTFAALLAPLGAAVGTSILGWFFGGELAGDAEDAARSGEAGVAAELERFARSARLVHDEYLQTLSAAAEASAEIRVRQQRVLAESAEAAEAIQRHITSLGQVAADIGKHLGADFLDSVRGIRARGDEVGAELAKTAAAAAELTRYLEQSHALVAEMERFMDFVTAQRPQHVA
jgi:hypothetical protein